MEWINVEGWEGFYQVSNSGMVKSLPRKYAGTKERLLKLNINKDGYCYVIFAKGRVRKHYLVHRLVANAFLDNPNNLPHINHKNEDKTDNRVENLEWCDAFYNTHYGTAISRRAAKQINRKDCSKAVNQYSITGEFIKKYESASEAERETGVRKTNISRCCRGLVKTAGTRNNTKYIWRYAVDTPERF